MCTLTLVAEEGGYRLAMNRDEKIARGAGTHPEAHELDGTRVIYPGDGGGGTWIGINEHGIALALLNWNDPTSPLGMEFQSRGQLIPAFIDSRSMAALLAASGVLALDHMRPFRMVGISPAERAVQEWRWDCRDLEIISHRWESQHWFSSGLSDEQALRARGQVCSAAWTEPDAGSSAWLRSLHASHSGGPDFGVCVHREDVQTLSYSEIHCTRERIAMEHFSGNPCLMQSSHSVEMLRSSPPTLPQAVQPASLLPL
jgi:hypothetical protein